MPDVLFWLEWLLGLGKAPRDLGFVNVGARAAVIYLAGLLIIRFGKSRFVAKNTVFDVVLGFILGSTLSRAINTDAPFFETILAGLVLMSIHGLFAILAYHSRAFGYAIKGKPTVLVKDGEVKGETLRRHHISAGDLNEALHLAGQVHASERVEAAYLERNGSISVLPKREPKVVHVDVKDGVQTVRIEMA